MECEKFVEPLDLVLYADSTDAYFSDALLHVKKCPVCAQKLSRRLEAESSVIRVMEEMAPPPSLHNSAVKDKSLRQWSRRRMLFRGAIAASILLLVGVSYPALNYWNSYKQQEALMKLCLLSIKNHEVTSGPEFVTSNRQEVSRWLTNRLGRLVKFPESINIDSVTLSARRAVLGEHTVAAVEFTIDGKRSTVFSYYPKQYDVEGITELPRTEMGYTVAFWSEQGLGFSLVSEASPENVKAVFSKKLKL